jgi:excinuclease ABC subunit C
LPYWSASICRSAPGSLARKAAGGDLPAGQSQRGILLPRHSQGLYLVQRVRDEAHRFAITSHRQRRDKAGVASRLDSIPGIGPNRRKALLSRFGSLDGIRKASVDELEDVPGIPKSLAHAIKSHLE